MVHAGPSGLTPADRPDSRLEDARALLSGVSSLQEMVTVLRDTAREIAGADGIAVVLREGEFCHYVAEDAIRPLWQGRRFRLKECLSGWAILNARSAVVPNVDTDPRLPAAAYRATSMRSVVMTPIGAPVPVAALGAYWCAWVEPGADTVQRLQALADLATAALDRLQAKPPEQIAS